MRFFSGESFYSTRLNVPTWAAEFPAALVAAIHAPFPHDAFRDVPAWMPGARPGMTAESELI